MSHMNGGGRTTDKCQSQFLRLPSPRLKFWKSQVVRHFLAVAGLLCPCKSEGSKVLRALVPSGGSPSWPCHLQRPHLWTSLLASESMFSSNRLQYAEEGVTQVQGGCRCAVCRGVADARMHVRVGVWLCIELCSHEVPQQDHYACRISMQSLQISCVGHTGSKRQEEDEGREWVQSVGRNKL